MVYGYIRVSTDSQDTENQKLGINQKAKSLGFEIQKWIEDDGVSGTKEPDKRNLGPLLKKVKKDDVIIASELSRLGRKLFMIMRILEHCMNNGVRVITVKDGYELGDNVQSKVLAFAFGLAAEIERNMISLRTKEALERKRAEGIVLGRPVGRKSTTKKLTQYREEILKMREQGFSLNRIANIYSVNRATVASIIEDNSCKRSVLPSNTLKINITSKDFLKLYEKNCSIAEVARLINCSESSLRNWCKRKGLNGTIEAINSKRRIDFPSKNTIEKNEKLLHQTAKNI